MNAPMLDSSRRGRPRDPRRDEAILTAALELVAEVGYDRMTIADLAERAGVSKPTIYLRWPDGKAEVVAQALDALHDDAAGIDTGTLRGDLVALAQAFIARLEANVHLAAGMACSLRASPQLASLVRAHAGRQRERVRVLLRRAEQRGELAGAAGVTDLFLDVAPSLIHTRARYTGEPLDAAFVDELVDHVLLPILSPHST